METFKIIFGKYFMANGFEVKVALKKGFENGYISTFIEVVSEHLKTGLKSNYKIPFYSYVTEEEFSRELERVKNYFSAPIPMIKNIEPINMNGIIY